MHSCVQYIGLDFQLYLRQCSKSFSYYWVWVLQPRRWLLICRLGESADLAVGHNRKRKANFCNALSGQKSKLDLLLAETGCNDKKRKTCNLCLWTHKLRIRPPLRIRAWALLLRNRASMVWDRPWHIPGLTPDEWVPKLHGQNRQLAACKLCTAIYRVISAPVQRHLNAIWFHVLLLWRGRRSM